MKLFMKNLTGEAFRWYIEQDVKKWSNWIDRTSNFMEQFRYNTDNSPNWFYMQRLRKNPNESLRHYTMRWKAEDARARPSIKVS